MFIARKVENFLQSGNGFLNRHKKLGKVTEAHNQRSTFHKMAHNFLLAFAPTERSLLVQIGLANEKIYFA